jgi:hypothetical protein
VAKQISSISDLVPDTNNANKGTVRGLAMLEDSIAEYGAGRSILIDADGNVIAGNKTLQAAIEKGMEVQVIQTDGNKLIAVQRVDLNLYKDKAARELAYADNRIAQTDLDWSMEAMLADTNSGIDLSKFFDDDELDVLLKQVSDESWSDAFGDVPTGDKPPFQQMTFTLSTAQAATVAAALKKAKAAGAFVNTNNANSNGNALWRICDAYLRG